MAYDEQLADRVREAITARPGVTERKMFGGVGWMVNGNMACGVANDDLIVRLSHEDAEAALKDPDARVFDMTGRPMRGWILVAAEGVEQPDDLARWVDAGADYAASLDPK